MFRKVTEQFILKVDSLEHDHQVISSYVFYCRSVRMHCWHPLKHWNLNWTLNCRRNGNCFRKCRMRKLKRVKGVDWFPIFGVSVCAFFCGFSVSVFLKHAKSFVISLISFVYAFNLGSVQRIHEWCFLLIVFLLSKESSLSFLLFHDSFFVWKMTVSW